MQIKEGTLNRRRGSLEKDGHFSKMVRLFQEVLTERGVLTPRDQFDRLFGGGSREKGNTWGYRKNLKIGRRPSEKIRAVE